MNMIERVARAIHDAMYSDEQSGAWMSGKCPLDSVTVDGDVDLIRAATAAIQAMREPTPEMKAMGFDAAWNEVSADIGQVEIQTTIGQTVWHYMIDAALIDASPIDTYEMEPIDTSFGAGEG